MPLRFVIIGNGPAGADAAITLRERLSPEQAEITLVSDEHDYFFSRTALMYAFMDRLERQDMEPYERSMWDKQQIRRLRDRATGLDAQAHMLTLRDGGQLPYDRLLIATGAAPRPAPFPGLDAVKDGVVHFVSMQDLDACERAANAASHAVVVGGGLIGVELVECLHHHKIPTTFLVREPSYWPAALTPPEGDMVTAHIRSHGVDLRLNQEIHAVAADAQGHVRSVQVKQTGAEQPLPAPLPCDMLGVCIGVSSANAWLKDAATPPRIERGICVDASFATSLPDVWAAGDCAQIERPGHPPLIETIWYSARRHGRLAALSMLGDSVHYQPPLFFNSSKFFEIEYTTVGQVTAAPQGTRAILRADPSRHLSQVITFGEDDAVLGFNMLGSRWNHRLLGRWVLERRSIGWVRQHLKDAQHDVELGRARIESLNEQEMTL
jgi:NADPH-dependent 2,4-dienoyl-CoA reductase/sulfur reductase-like enzyme